MSGPRRSAQWRGGIGLATGLAISTLSLAAASAASVSTSTLQAKASAISAKISAANIQLSALSEAYLHEHAALDQAVTNARNLAKRINSLRIEVSSDRKALKTDAIVAYVHDSSGDSIGLLLAGSPGTVALGDAYLKVATGQLDQASTLLTESMHTLQGAELAQQRDAALAASAEAQTTADRGIVLQAVQDEQQLYASVHGELATLVARAQAETEAAAAKADSVSAGPPSPIGIVNVAPGFAPIPPGSLAQAFSGIRNCESGGRYSLDTGNGYYGAYQFSYSTWIGLGGTGLASQASPAEQDALAYRLYQSSGWHAWPECSAILGLG